MNWYPELEKTKGIKIDKTHTHTQTHQQKKEPKSHKFYGVEWCT